MLQEQNQELHHSLLQTAMRMECMGEEFKSSHELLESELQRTHVELTSLLDKFKRLQDNYSSTQQTNNLLERKLHSVAQNMDGDRERLNQRISALTDQLAKARTTIHSMETIHVTPVLQEELEKHFQSDSINQFVIPVAPPPPQFMDGRNYGKVMAMGEDQYLGPVPEEEESDWSEMGEEAPRCGVRGSCVGFHGDTAFLPWRQAQGHWAGQGEGDTDSGSGSEDVVKENPPTSLKIPHLQFTMHPESAQGPGTEGCSVGFNNPPASLKCEGGYRVSTIRRLGSPVRVLSASLEEISTGRAPHHRPGEQGLLRGTEAMLDLHHPDEGAMEDFDDDEIIHNWRTRGDRGLGGEGGLEARGAEDGTNLVNLQSAQRMLNHFISQLQPGEGDGEERGGSAAG
ncbi:uncharacterized protein si:dkey-273o13.3 [Osmerus eperlanus]|uniref:uncharacterized protein si:dkey-273o13.3 n=1 Tax=Osmerus eperlanus TaxID=29151 RepID=UPI002E11687C